MKKVLPVMSLIVYSLVVKAQSYTFTQSTYTTNSGFSFITNVLKGDFNNDGKMDLVKQDQASLITYLQASSNTFTSVNISYAIPSLEIYNCSDYNGDGKLDVLANNNQMFIGNGNGTFSLTTINQNISSYLTTSSDFNNDGIKDIASVNSSTNSSLSIYLGLGNANFNAPITYSLTGGTGGGWSQPLLTDKIAVNDLNNDNNKDLVISTVVNTGTVTVSYLSIYLGNGNGTFNLNNTYPYSFDINTVKICDANTDGKQDIVFNFNNGVNILQGDGIGGFTSYYNQTIPSSAIDIGDLNNDSKIDIINFNSLFMYTGCATTNTVSIIENTGSSFSVNSNTFSINSFEAFQTPILCDDYNNDGKMDLAVNTFSCTPSLHICFNYSNLTTGINELTNGNYISLHPNPTNGALIVNSTTELQKIEVMAITGQLLISEVPASTSHTSTSSVTVLHLDHLANGVYFVNLYQNNHIVKREKIILNK